jgi:hypothetical protein
MECGDCRNGSLLQTPILYRNMGIEMFCNFVEESIHEATFLEPIYGDETKMKATKNLELETSEQFFLSLSYITTNHYLLIK